MKSIDKLREWADGLRGIWLDPNDHSIIVMTCDDMVPLMDCVSLREHVNGILDGIEREVAEERTAAYNEGYDAGFASADDWLADHEDAMAEHGWVRKNKEHVISHATVEVTPHIDWSRMADELDEFVEIVRGMAGDAE